MSESVIVIAASNDYLPQAKALMVNCVRQGSWKGDFCLIVPGDCQTVDIEQRGIFVAQTAHEKWKQTVKFWVFSPYFGKWKRLLYLDCDILIQGNLNDACDEMAKKLPAIVCDGGMNPEGGTILANWEHFDNLHGPGRDAHPEVYEELEARFPHVNELVFTSDAMFFAPETIPGGTVAELQIVAEEFKEANSGDTDQAVTNLILYGRMVPMTKDICCWFAFDYPENRVPCPARGWRGDEEPAILHYWNMYAPWLIKQEGAGGHWNHRLERVCHELYAENLAAFEEVFPETRET